MSLGLSVGSRGEKRHAPGVQQSSVEALACPADKRRAFLWDDHLSGFGVIAYPPRQRDGQVLKVYIVRYWLNGRMRRVKIGTHGDGLNAKDARAKAKVVLGEIAQKIDPIDRRRTEQEERERAAMSVRTVRQVAGEYMRTHVTPKKKPRTKLEYQGLLDNHILPALGRQPFVGLKKVHVARLHASMEDRPGAANRTVSLISGIWSWAAKRDEVLDAANPTRGLERYPEKPKERYLSTDELLRLGDALRLGETEGFAWKPPKSGPRAKHRRRRNPFTRLNPHAVAAIRLLILTGARLREILHAKWDYVDWDRGLLLLPDSKTGPKTIYLPAPAFAVLQSLERTESPFIIPGSMTHKQQMDKSSAFKPRSDLQRPWQQVAHAAGLKGVRLHDLRHSFASTGAGASLGLPMIGKLLGHTQPQTTARYAHLDADPMRRAANVIGNQIDAAMRGAVPADVIPLDDHQRKANAK